jgi:hypothetical protein
MNEEYKLVKEARIALLCVGDKMYRIHPRLGMFNHQIGRHDTYNLITEETVMTIVDKHTIETVTKSGFVATVYTDEIDMHQGELYIWNVLDRYYRPEHKGDVDKMIEIINSDTTIHENW